LVHGEDNKDVANVDAFVGRTVVFRLQVGSKPHEDRSLAQGLWPDVVFDVEGVKIDRTGEGYVGRRAWPGASFIAAAELPGDNTWEFEH
jgi:hypothetical protein